MPRHKRRWIISGFRCRPVVLEINHWRNRRHSPVRAASPRRHLCLPPENFASFQQGFQFRTWFFSQGNRNFRNFVFFLAEIIWNCDCFEWIWTKFDQIQKIRKKKPKNLGEMWACWWGAKLPKFQTLLSSMVLDGRFRECIRSRCPVLESMELKNCTVRVQSDCLWHTQEFGHSWLLWKRCFGCHGAKAHLLSPMVFSYWSRCIFSGWDGFPCRSIELTKRI